MKQTIETKHGTFKYSKSYKWFETKRPNEDISVSETFIKEYSFEQSTEIIDYILQNKDVIYAKVADEMLDIYNDDWRSVDVFINGIPEYEWTGDQTSLDAEITTKDSPILSKSEFIERLSIFDIAFDHDEDDDFSEPVNIYIKAKGDLFTDHSLIAHMDINKTIKYVGL
ncbi:hypothetical protein LNTAR_06374 [Lentisphaera araneosa HTCC2155]|jgi:hypothetical protein|uniref:Uncharacterized protein n=1 Tax=Lentisphaera araneosa HTCC2155 TaxID=313628 RepID=A6DNA1_9BACT|nr:DUF2262 domain-containing protein [Lentisphaera araneosa]EDM25286.1 hypothetical protein LNTAR_24943 [Lentisphaera araneosa HTCC2155]EDM26849.1 hypothetical protein LNTAR_06374 [Lentisphaera araneosa HTCC2155]